MSFLLKSMILEPNCLSTIYLKLCFRHIFLKTRTIIHKLFKVLENGRFSTINFVQARSYYREISTQGKNGSKTNKYTDRDRL